MAIPLVKPLNDQRAIVFTIEVGDLGPQKGILSTAQMPYRMSAGFIASQILSRRNIGSMLGARCCRRIQWIEESESRLGQIIFAHSTWVNPAVLTSFG